MAAPSMVSRDGEHTLVKSVNAVFGESEEEEEDEDPSEEEDEENEVGEGDNETEGNNSGQEGGSLGSGEDPELPQCKIKRNYSCSHCDFYTQNPRSYLHHLKQEHKAKIKIYECPHCLYASKHSQKLQRHVHMVHVSRKKKISKRLMKKKKLKRLVTVPKGLTPLPSPPPEGKKDAEETSDNEDGAKKSPDEEEDDDRAPIFSIDGTQVYKCSECELISENKAMIIKHERIIHLKKKLYKCNKCNYMTHIKARFTKHVKYHSMPMIKCDLCDFKTPYKWNLDRHNKNHNGDGAFKCSVCNFAADIKQSLTVHEMNHHIPPVGHYYAGPKRRLRVGASDSMGMFTEEDALDDEEVNLLRMEREDSMDHLEQNPADFLQTQLLEPPSSSGQAALSQLSSTFPHAYTSFPRFPSTSPQGLKLSGTRPLHEVSRPFTNGSTSGGLIQIQKYTCKQCDFSGNLGEVQRHESAVHGMNDLQAFRRVQQRPGSAAPAKRPIPNLIPIQGQSILRPPSERPSSSNGGSVGNSKSNSPTRLEEKLRFEEKFRKKNASFFDSLRDKLAAEQELTCNFCGFKAKCLTEQIEHRKTHAELGEKEANGSHSQGEQSVSSTRCQHCRHRCKSSADLLVHLKSCSAALTSSTDQAVPSSLAKEEAMDVDDIPSKDSSSHPMENKVFVWNDFGQNVDQSGSGFQMNFYQPRADRLESADFQQSYPNIIPPSPSHGHDLSVKQKLLPPLPPPPPPPPQETTRKVFKCPSCSFWASTASRFHVHIVGHLNKRPFQCSLCQYSSNWRWDITKHIRLKMMRDQAHEKARVLLTDEAGRRNYSKYNKYLVPIPLEEFRRAQIMRKNPDGSIDSSQREKMFVMNNKRATEGKFEEESQKPAKKSFPENKKTMWKCKKCLFRNSDRAVVLAHVKEHYRALSITKVQDKSEGKEGKERSGAGSPGAKREKSLTPELREDNSMREIASVLQKRSEVTLFRKEQESQGESESSDEFHEFMCETCPYVCESSEKLEEHAELHFVTHGCNFKCLLCPFYAENEKQLLGHMELHNKVEFSDTERKAIFSCGKCPYVGSSREQFLYHQKWHGKDYDHKCYKCDYSALTNITLSLHVRLHRRTSPVTVTQEKPPKKPVMAADISGIDTSKFPDVPMVWVAKSLGISKMFKCRFCCHFNMRKVSVLDHEKLHRANEQNGITVQHRCLHCSFITNSISLYTSHLKVHEEINGQICGVVDFKKTDEEQIEAMKKKVKAYEEKINKNSQSDGSQTDEEQETKEPLILHFCQECPARFLFLKEVTTHQKFHLLDLPFKCDSCSYNARLRPHLTAHMKVHSDEYTVRTSALTQKYPVNKDFPQPKVVVVLGEHHETNFNWKRKSVWVVVKENGETNSEKETKEKEVVSSDDLKENEFVELKKKKCSKCPAEFSKEDTFTFHMSLHGGEGHHKCKYCDYAVKTYGNLLRHEAIHTRCESPAALSLKARQSQTNGEPKSIPGEVQENGDVDPTVGNPNFVYFTSEREKKSAEKRGLLYKCHKCPTVMGKKVHYLSHMACHGATHKYACDKCDYADKFYSTFLQHKKKHSLGNAKKKQDSEVEEKNEKKSPSKTVEIEEPPYEKPIIPRPGKSRLSLSDKQVTMILEAKANRENVPIKCTRCPYCSSNNKLIQKHQEKHTPKNSGSTCKYCDYCVSSAQALKNHTKHHFQPLKYYKPDAYLKFDRIEIYAEPVDANSNKEKTLIFKDNGPEEEFRFFPDVDMGEDFEQMKGRVYINLKTGEQEVEMDDEDGEDRRRGIKKSIDEKMDDWTEGMEEGGEIKEEIKEEPQEEMSCDSIVSHGSATTASSV